MYFFQEIFDFLKNEKNKSGIFINIYIFKFTYILYWYIFWKYNAHWKILLCIYTFFLKSSENTIFKQYCKSVVYIHLLLLCFLLKYGFYTRFEYIKRQAVILTACLFCFPLFVFTKLSDAVWLSAWHLQKLLTSTRLFILRKILFNKGI